MIFSMWLGNELVLLSTLLGVISFVGRSFAAISLVIPSSDISHAVASMIVGPIASGTKLGFAT